MSKRSQFSALEHHGFSATGETPPAASATPIADQADASAVAITPLDITGAFTLGSGSVVKYGAAPLPAGLSIDSQTGIISGTPTTPGVTQVKISVSTTVPPVARGVGFQWTIT